MGLTKWVIPEALAPGFAGRIDVDPDDHVGAREPQPLDHVEADAAETEHDAIGAGLDLGGIEHRLYAGGHPAADVADLIKGRIGADLGQSDLGQHREIGGNVEQPI